MYSYGKKRRTKRKSNQKPKGIGMNNWLLQQNDFAWKQHLKKSNKYPMVSGHLFFKHEKSNGKRVTPKIIKQYPELFSEQIKKRYKTTRRKSTRRSIKKKSRRINRRRSITKNRRRSIKKKTRRMVGGTPPRRASSAPDTPPSDPRGGTPDKGFGSPAVH